MAGVDRNAINIAGVDHDRMSTGRDGCPKGWHEVFAEVILRYKGWRTVLARKGKAVAHVMFQTCCDVICLSDIRAFISADRSHAHDLRQIGILSERFVE